MVRTSETRRVCRVRLPNIASALRTNRRAFGAYASGALFAAGWWIFLDACVRSHHLHRPPPGDEPFQPPGVSIKLDDWVSGLSTTLGLAIVNMINKQHLLDEGALQSGAWNEDPVLWRTRMWLFIGFAFLAGGMAGSMAVLIIKYMANNAAEGLVELGVAGVVQNMAIMACAVILWFSQRVESDYEYNLTL